MKKLNICGFFLICFVVCCAADCPLDVSTRDDEVFIYSNVMSTYDQALMICQSYGGDIFDIHAEDRQYFIDKFEEFYLKGLAEVLIYNKTQEHAPNRTYDFHKYRAHGISKDKSNLNGFKKPPTGELSSIRLGDSESNANPIRVEFCYVTSRDLINSLCSTGDGWHVNFFLYGADGDANNTIQVYNYYAEDIGATSKFSLTPIVGTYWRQVTEAITDVYLQDISVFIGAKSQLSKTNWSWSDGQGVGNPMFPPSNLSMCQQMTWPLTYDDGINLRPTDCNTGTAYFACRVLFIAKLEEIHCNATSLLLSWEPLSAVFSDANLMKGQLSVNFHPTEDPQTFEIDLEQSNVTLHGLKQRTTYYINIRFTDPGILDVSVDLYTSISLHQPVCYRGRVVKACVPVSLQLHVYDCFNFNPTASSSGRTGYGVPDPVTSAYVNNSDNQCNIVWTHNATHTEIESYQIFFISASKATNKTAEANGQSYTVDMSLFDYNTTLSFQILAISKCEEKSERQPVNGTCKTPLPPTTTVNVSSTFAPNTPADNGFIIGISVGGGILLIIVVVAFAFVCGKRKNQKSSANVDDVDPNMNAHVEITIKEENPHRDSNQFKTDKNKKETLINIRSKEKSTSSRDANDYETPITSEYTIAKKDLKNFYSEECLNNFSTLSLQFQTLKEVSSVNEPKHGLSTTNKPLNRYMDVFTYDHAAVPLSGNKYINASFIEGFKNAKQFIATQGPKPNTIGDFWEMVWMQKSRVIIMLCKCKEKNKTKCEKYWPSKKGPQTFQNWSLILLTKKTFGDIIRREISIKNNKNQEEKTVVQYQYTGWPDHDVPCTTSSMSKLRHLVKSEQKTLKSKSPIIVHCSAGAGRTGTYIAIDNLINEIKQTQRVNVFNVVLNMRKNRKEMVQNLSQYLFIHKVVAESLVLPETGIDVDHFPDTIQNTAWLDKHSSDEFALLSDVILTTPALPKSKLADDENEYVNVSQSSKTDQHQVPVFDKEHRVHMDAHFVQMPYFDSASIVASQPTSKKEGMFWRMVSHRNINFILALEQQNLISTKVNSIGEAYVGNDIEVLVEDVEENSELITSNISMLSNKISQSLTHITIKMEDKKKFPNISSCLKVWKKITSNSNSTVLFYCKDGCKVSGQFLTLMMNIDQIRTENKVDVLRTVKDLKAYRPTLIKDEQQYKECYELVSDYMEICDKEISSSIYQNV